MGIEKVKLFLSYLTFGLNTIGVDRKSFTFSIFQSIFICEIYFKEIYISSELISVNDSDEVVIDDSDDSIFSRSSKSE